MKFINNTAIGKRHDDEALISEYKNSGNMDALGTLYNKYMPLVYGVCYKYFQSEDQSKDAVMHIFEELVEKLKVHQVQNFKSWLHVLTKNHCLMVLRKKSKAEIISIDDSFVENSNFEHLDIDQTKESQFLIMEKCLNTLSIEQRKCVELFYLEEKCYKDISSITGFDLLKVKSYIQNGKRNLKICIDKEKSEH